MALTTTVRGSGTSYRSTTSATTFAFSPDADLVAGSWGVLCVAADNAGSSGAAMSTFSVTDTKGNTWTRQLSPLYNPAGASSGVEGAIFTTPQNGGVLTTIDIITVSFGSTTVDSKAVVLLEVAPDIHNSVAYVSGGVNTGANTASPTVTTSSIDAGCVLIGAAFGESLGFTADADTTGGTWSDQSQSVASTGSIATSITVAAQSKVATSTGTQTYSPTCSTVDVILGWIALEETLPPTVAADATALNISIPHWRQPRSRVMVRKEFNPIGGVQPGGFGFQDSLGGTSFTVGSGITLADTRGEARSLDFTVSNTGLTKAVSYTDHPFSFVGYARATGTGSTQFLGSIATTADKLVRVWYNGSTGACSAQHLGSVTNATASTPAMIPLGDVFSVVAVFRSPTDVRVYARGAGGANRSGEGGGINPAVSTVGVTTNVGALAPLNKFSIGVYDGSVKAGQFVGQIFMAEWLRCALDPSQAWQFVNNPWLLYEPDVFFLPAGFTTSSAATATLDLQDAADSTAVDGAIVTTATAAVQDAADTAAVGGANIVTLTSDIQDAVDTAAATGLNVVYGYPISDVAANGWTPSTGTDLFAMLDEPTTANVTDYIYSPDNPTTQEFEVMLGSLNPVGIFIGLKAVGLDTTFTFKLMEGTTQIESWTESVTVAEGDVTREHVYNPTNIATITDPSNLRLRGKASV